MAEEQEQVPDLQEVARWLAGFYDELRGIRSLTAAPVNYSIDAEALRPWLEHRDNRRQTMQDQLSWFRNLMVEEFNISHYIPEVLENEHLHHENAMMRFKESEEPLEQRLAQVEQAFTGSFDIVLGLIEEVMGKYDFDQKVIAQAAESARLGNFSHATDVMGSASRLFKNVAYWQPDRQASKMASTLNSIEKDFKARQAKVEELTAGLEENKQLRASQAVNQARQLISEASGELFRARKAFPDATADSPFATSLAALEAQIIAWQGEQAARLDQADKSTQNFKKKLISLGIIAGIVLFLAFLVFLWSRTGYRIVSPDGKVFTASFCLPGTYTEKFQVPGFQPYTAQIPVSFGFYNDMGQVDTKQLKPFTNSISLTAQPAGVSYRLEGQGDNIATTKEGELPAELKNLPVGDYKVTLTLGDHTESHSIALKKGEPMKQDYVVQAGNLELTTDPKGAAVSLDGKPIGKAPLTLTGLSVGQHEILLKVEANTITLPFEIKAGEVTKLDHTFGFGGLKLTTNPPGAKLTFVDAETLPSSKAPYSNDQLIARDYTVRAELPGLDPKDFTVTVSTDQTTEETLTLDFASLDLTAQPVLGTQIMIEGLPAEKFSGPAPLKIPVIKPGTYTIVATTTSKQRLPKEVEVKAGERDKKVTFEFANGKLTLRSSPEDLTVSVPALKLYNKRTPYTLDSAVVGDYSASFNQGDNTIRRKFTIEKDKETVVEVNFLNASLKDRTDIPETDKKLFSADRTIEAGVGLKQATVGGNLEEALKAYGKPNSVRTLPDPNLGLRYILNYANMGFSISTNGNTIQALNFTQIPNRDINRRPPPYWARTSKGVTIGDAGTKLQRAYGNPVGSVGAQGLMYPGITFFLRGTSGGGREVVGIRISEEELKALKKVEAQQKEKAAAEQKPAP